jgi:hypothetical protein
MGVQASGLAVSQVGFWVKQLDLTLHFRDINTFFPGPVAFSNALPVDEFLRIAYGRAKRRHDGEGAVVWV